QKLKKWKKRSKRIKTKENQCLKNSLEEKKLATKHTRNTNRHIVQISFPYNFDKMRLYDVPDNKS
ncbi:hypothetical protein, partial [Desulfobacula sp.]|uniref:hypothetical protein n=1 Tax=Desulfobacula sp. TaxID=2593537 RepID=UPI00260F9568